MINAYVGIAFATSGEESDKKTKKKERTCYKCKKTGPFYNKCDEEETVKTSNRKVDFLILKKDKFDSSLDAESKVYNNTDNKYNHLHEVTENKYEEQNEESNNKRRKHHPMLTKQ